MAFEGEGGLKGEACDPIAKLALAYLGLQWPGRISFENLREIIHRALGAPPNEAILSTVLRKYNEMVAAEVQLRPAAYANTIGERPRTSVWALYQQKLGGGITTLRHHTVHIQDPFGLWLVGHLDGEHTPEQIAHKLASTVRPDADGHLDFDKELREARQLVTEGLEKFVRLGLLTTVEHSPVARAGREA